MWLFARRRPAQDEEIALQPLVPNEELEEDVLVDENLVHGAQETEDQLNRKCVTVVVFLSLLYISFIVHLVYFYYELHNPVSLVQCLRAFPTQVSFLEVCCIFLLFFSLVLCRHFQTSRLSNWKALFYCAYCFALPFSIFGQLVLFIRRFVSPPLHTEISPTILAVVFLSCLAFVFIIISVALYIVRVFCNVCVLHRMSKDRQ